MSPVQERAEKLERARNLRPPRERMFPVNPPADRQMSRVQEKAGRLGRPRNLQLPPRRERMFPVNRPVCRRPARSSRLSSGGKG